MRSPLYFIFLQSALVAAVLVSLLGERDYMRTVSDDPYVIARGWTAALLTDDPNFRACPGVRAMDLTAASAESQAVRPVRAVFLSPEVSWSTAYPSGMLARVSGLVQFEDGGEEAGYVLVWVRRSACVAGARIGALDWQMLMGDVPGYYGVMR